MYVYMQEISIENINCKSRSYLHCNGLLFQVVVHFPGIRYLFFFMCVSLSQTSVYRPEQMSLFVSFCQHLVPEFASLMFCQHVIGQSLSPASFLNLSIKSCRTIIQLSCTVLLTNKIYFQYSQELEKFLFICYNHIYSQNKNNFQKG